MLQPKPLFYERMKLLLGDETDYFFEYCHKPLSFYIRTNKIKISPEELFERLSKKWQIEKPFLKYPEIIKIISRLEPGELGKAIEHVFGYYYIQEIASMMSIIALQPETQDKILDLCASPGSKTTQIASELLNSGMIIANDNKLDRIKILASNLERCSVTNAIVTKDDGAVLCSRLEKIGLKFDKILVDAPCSGEGTLRSDIRTFKIWNINMIKKFSNTQKRLVASSLSCLKPEGTLIYSTCTHAPEENEEIVDYIFKNFNVSIEKIDLPLKTRAGIREWQGKEFSPEIKNCCRIYPQDNDTEGFFIAKFKKLD